MLFRSSVGPTIVRARAAEAFANAAITWPELRVSADVADEFGRLTAQAATPIDDQRGTAAYRRHAVAVCARRALVRAAEVGAR